MTRKNKKENKALKKLLIIIGSIIILSLLITFYLIKNTNYINPNLQTKIDTSNWKNFSNDKYNFSFKYPSRLNIIFPAPSFNSNDKIDFDSASALYLEGNKKPMLELTLNVMSTSGTSIQVQRKSFLYPGSKNIESEIIIDGIKGYKFTSSDSNDVTILVENNDTIFSISKGQAMSKAEFDSIIDSFRFTE